MQHPSQPGHQGRAACLLRLVFLATLLLRVGPIVADELPVYQAGDRATNDFASPIALTVLDPDQTEELKLKEAARVPVICRYYTNVVDQAEEKMRQAFSTARSNFLDRLEATYNRRKIGPQTVAAPKFERLVASFQKQHKAFPLSTNLAIAWAMGQPDRVLLSSLAATLRESMSRPIRPPTVPPEVRLTLTVRLIGLGSWTDAPTLEQVDRLGRNTQRTNIIGINRAREEVQELFPESERAMGRFLSLFLITNCVPDIELTMQARARRTEALYAADHYQAGQLIVTQGQVIDKKVVAALQQLREKQAVGLLDSVRAQAATGARPIQAGVPPAAQAGPLWISIGAGIILLAIGLIVGFIWMARRRSLLPATIANRGAGPHDVRQGLFPHLARMLMHQFVQKLIADRSQLLDSHQQALAELTELEARLEKIHAPLQERLRAYEQRIGELEKELVRKGEENRQLIKAKIEMIRHQLAATRDRLPLN